MTALKKSSFYFSAAILALGLGLSACNGSSAMTDATTSGGGTTDTKPNPTSPPVDASALYTGPAELAKYVEKFVSDAKIQGVDVTSNMSNPKLEIQIGSLSAYGSSVIGLCETGGGKRRVTFSTTFWNSVSETQRELLAHHELGHCVLYRAHRTTLLSDGAYASLMYPIIMGSSTYLNNYNYYQQELFAQAASDEGGVDPNVSTIHICDQKELAGVTE